MGCGDEMYNNYEKKKRKGAFILHPPYKEHILGHYA